MMFESQEDPGVDQIFDRVIEQNPHNRDLLKAFQPIISRQRELARLESPMAADFCAIDKGRLKSGVPVISQINLLSPEEPWDYLTFSIASAVKEGLPWLAEGLDRLSNRIQMGDLHLWDYFKAYPNCDKGILEFWVARFDIPPEPFCFVLNLVTRVILEQKARALAGPIGEIPWEKGYCPICGDLPSIALIEETGGKRFLHCSSCGHDWRFTRVVCPACDNQAQQGMTYFYVENNPQESAFVCEKCRKYLITLNRAGNLHARDMDVTAIGMMHLDVLMQQKGYDPMTANPWNILK